ncbi:hypothetical protein LTR66_017136 [Elasticomyces elasticus]|nr:hypothetical protein LTR66_017136 [Elasticomyces elasticus]
MGRYSTFQIPSFKYRILSGNPTSSTKNIGDLCQNGPTAQSKPTSAPTLWIGIIRLLGIFEGL